MLKKECLILRLVVAAEKNDVEVMVVVGERNDVEGLLRYRSRRNLSRKPSPAMSGWEEME